METELTAVREGRKATWGVALALFGCFSLIYIVFRSAAYNGDMVWQSCVAEGFGPVHLAPDHLLYQPMVRGIWLSWRTIGLPGGAHVALETVNALFGGVMVAMMFLLISRVTGRRFLAGFVAAVFGFTPYVWHHATDVETYATTKAFQLIAVYLIVLLAEGGPAGRRYRLAFATGAFHAIATYFQYEHVMLVPAVIVAALLPNDGVRVKERIKVAGMYLVTVGLLVWVPFLYVAFAVERVSGLGGFWSWLTSPGYGWPMFARMGWMNTPLKFVAGFANWPTPFAVPEHEAKRVLLGYVSLSHYLSEYWWRLVIVCVLALLQVGLLLRLVLSAKRAWARWRRPIIVALTVVFFYQGFQIYWAGGFVNLAMPAYVLLLALGFDEAIRTRVESGWSRFLVGVVPWICAGAAAGALVFSYIPEHDPKNNLDLQETLDVGQRLDGKDLLVTPGGCLTSEYFDYFAPDVRVLRLQYCIGAPGTKDPLGELRRNADEAIKRTLAAGGRVFVHRVYANEDELTVPWNELLFAKVRRKDVVEHLEHYPHREAFVSHGHTYWQIVSTRGETQ